MGYFMDRHDLRHATEADLLAAHRRDRAVQDRHGVRCMSFWFDYDRQAAFCLVEAPSADAAQEVHSESHGHIANEIIPVDRDAVVGFLGRIDDPLLTGRHPESAFRIILFTDLEGSTGMTQRLGDAGAMRLLRIHDGIIRDCLARHGGSEVKHTGDGIMASFASVQDSLCAAVDIQRGFADHNRSGGEEERMAVRIGISAGEPVAEGRDLFGAAVQLAARLCAQARPGSIVAAAVVADLAIGKAFRFGPRSDLTLHGFTDPVAACEVVWKEAA